VQVYLLRLGLKLLPLTKKANGEVGRIWADAERLGGPVTWMQRSEITRGFIDAAIHYMSKAQQKGNPFYVNIWPDDVHSPFWPPGLMAMEHAGKRNKNSVFAAIDLVPSLLRLAGAKCPKNVAYGGEDLLDIILGRSQASRKAPIFFSRPPDRKSFYGFTDLPDLAVRQGKWKLLCDYNGSRPELYDIFSDPSESKNLAGLKPEVTRMLSNEVVRWYQSMPGR
jgi:hypothetical protein